MASSDSHCNVYWGSHGCDRPKNHPGDCYCDCAYDIHGHRQPFIDSEGVRNGGGPPYYGPDTVFYGDDVPQRLERLRKAVNNH